MNRSCFLLVAFLVLVLFASSVFAIPNMISYQGTMTDNVGVPVDGDHAMEFVIYDDEFAGSMVWGESHASVAITNGIYNVLLGSGILFPLSPPLTSDIFATPTLWLEVKVGSETLTPRQRLLAVPYAMTAAVASSLAPGVVPCNPGDFVNCYSGQNGTMNIGICQSGTRACNPDGAFGSCTGEVIPASEVCNDLDDDCNGLTDDNAADATTWFADIDADGYGDLNSPQVDCDQPIGYIIDATDCLDSDATVYPTAYEVCDGIDNDCNTQIDDSCGQPRACDEAEQAIVDSCAPLYDTDPFEFMDCVSPQVSETCNSALISLGFCGAGSGCGNPLDDLACYLANCPDQYSAYAGGPAECTFATTRTCGTDVGECQSGIESCVYGGIWEGFCTGSVGPEEEVCGNGLDDDCDGSIDEPADFQWCRDADSDGTLDLATCTSSCEAPGPDYAQDIDGSNYDCDDTNPEVNPWQPEICGDGIDNDCTSGTPDIEDLDTDGYDCSVDCDDQNADINPGAPEICGDLIDNDCNVTTFDLFDADSDGSDCQNDCNDSDPLISPLEDEVCGDGIDNNCNLEIDELCGSCSAPNVVTNLPFSRADDTLSANNFLDPVCGGNTSDGPEHVYEFTPASTALYSASVTADFDTTLYFLDDCNNDNSCSLFADLVDSGEYLEALLFAGTTYYIVVDGYAGGSGSYNLTVDIATDGDSDGYSDQLDCDDADPLNYPGNLEICDGQDNNCDDLIDETCIGQACNDGDLCTENDIYIDNSGSAVCVGTPKDCSWLDDQCNDGACNPTSGSCEMTPNVGANCDDANQSTYDDTCDADGSCFGTFYSCDDGLACTTDTPDGLGGCTNTVNAGFCLVGGICSSDGALISDCEECNSAVSQTSGILLPMGAPCGDQTSDACTNPDTCDASGFCLSNDEPNTTVCRPESGLCDVAETCDGVGNCPADQFQPSSFVCRLSTGSCDIEETCSGANPSCPSDALETAGTACDDFDPVTYNDQCDGSGICSGIPAICGDGSIDANEACDDANTDACGTCNATCDGPGTGGTCSTGIGCSNGTDCASGVCTLGVCE